MQFTAIIELLNNAALLLALGLIYDTIGFRLKGAKHSYILQILTGAVLGIVGIALMLNSWNFGNGVIFDARSVLLCIVGLFFGTIPVSVAMIFTSIYRLSLGGSGALTGISVIVTSGAIGLSWRHLRSKVKDPSISELYILGIVVHLVMLACMLLMPWQNAINVLSRVTLPVVLIYPLATLILGKLLVNINRRRLAEEALQESMEAKRAIIEASPLAIFSLDGDGFVITWNRAAEQIFGWKEEELIGRILPIVQEDQQEVFANLRKSAIGGQSISRLELVRQRKDGSPVDISLSIGPILDKDGKPIVIMAVAEDITERKKNEKEKESLNAQLNQAQKMESIGRLAGGVAHDYNNMLSVILGYTELAEENLNSVANVSLALKEIKRATNKSIDITRQLLAFSRKQTISPRILDLNKTIESMFKMLQHLIGENINLAWSPDNSIWPIKMDPSQVDQILANLCVNARDAIDDVGKITIESGTRIFDEAYCETHAGFVPGEFVMLSISDDGCGMDNEVLEHAFEPFYTTKEMGKGTGLGLAMIYGIVKQNDGFINIYSEPDHGTTVTIYFPRTDAPIKVIQDVDNSAVQTRGSETVLLVEDEKMILKLTKTMLELNGYAVMDFTEPDEALEYAREHTDDIHVLITDVVMPRMNGRRLAQEIKAICPFIKVLFVSGYTENAITHQGVLDEGVNFLQKPFSQQELATKLRIIIDD